MKNLHIAIPSLIIGLLIAAGASYTMAWTVPPGTPPNCPAGYAGCDAPINVSSNPQIKGGSITVGTSLIAGGSNPTVSLRTLGGQVAFGTSAGETVPTGADFLRVLVKGNVGAAKYCDEAGQNCHASSEIGGGGSGASSAGLVPSGAVMAFDSLFCPTGWSVYNPAVGRNIIGLNVANTGNNPLGSTGGEVTHTLTVAELPSHSHHITDPGHEHRVRSSQEKDAQSGNTDTNIDNVASGGKDDIGVTQKAFIGITNTDPKGGDTAFNVMDPYVRLLYCKKNFY